MLNKLFSIYYLNSGHLNLLDFGLEMDGKKQEEKLFKLVRIKIYYSTSLNKYLTMQDGYFQSVPVIVAIISIINHIIHCFSNENLLKNNLS